MKLSVLDRLTILQRLPNVGNYEGVIIVKSLSKKLDLSVSEMEKLDFKEELGPAGESRLTWDKTKDDGKQIELTLREFRFLNKYGLLLINDEFIAEYEKVALSKEEPTKEELTDAQSVVS